MAAVTASQDLDPTFLKAISLLHSRNPDSANQLKVLVENYRDKLLGNISTKKSDGRESPVIDGNKSINAGVRIQPVPSITTSVASEGKRATSPMLDTKFTGEESVQQILKTNPMEESIEEITVGSSLQPVAKRKKKASQFENMGISSPDSDLNDSIPIDQIIEMDFAGPTCNICHLSKRGEEENALMECSECHLSYHQKCHKPNVTTKELNDPRLIWYCSKCVKKMKKEMAAQQQASSNKTTTAAESATPKALSNPFQQTKPFRRISTIQTNERSTAANAQSSSSDQSSTVILADDNNAATSSSREGSPISNKMNRSRDMTRHAMNRLEQVKKRAKLQQAFKQVRK